MASLSSADELQARVQALRNQVADIEEAQGQTTRRPMKKKVKYLYDNGRNDITAFNPKNKQDTFYARNSNKDTKFSGDLKYHSVSSLDYVYGPDAHSFDVKLQYGHRQTTKEFSDRGHL